MTTLQLLMEHKLKDKIRACFIGYAIGDTLGKGTEFMTKDEVTRRYPNGLRTYGGIIRDAHRSQWLPNGWTNDTEVLLRTADTITEAGSIDPYSQARMLRNWLQNDFVDMAAMIRYVIMQPDYENDPIAVSRRVWEETPHDDASNEALGRAMLGGLWPGADYPDRTQELVLMTHYHHRCLTSGHIISRVAHSLLWEEEISFEDLYKMCGEFEDEMGPYLKQAHDGTLEDLELDDPDRLWYTRKAMGCALYTLWHCNSMQEALYRIVDEGGDADTNAALSLGLLGLRYGTAALPEYLTQELAGLDRLMATADRFAETLGTNADAVQAETLSAYH